MKVTNRIFNLATKNAVEKITKFSRFKSMNTFFDMSKLKFEYDANKQKFEFMESNIVNDLCDKDEEGKPIPGPNGSFTFNTNRAEFQSRYTALLDEEIDLKIEMIIIDPSIEVYLFPEFNEEYMGKNPEAKNLLDPSEVAALHGLVEFKIGE